MRPPRCAPPPARARGRPCTADSDGLRCLASGQDGLDRLFGAYKLRLPSLGGYLLDGVDLVPSRLLTLLTDVSKVELEFLREDEDEQRRIKRARGKEGGKEGGEGTEGAEADDAAARMAGGGGAARAAGVPRSVVAASVAAPSKDGAKESPPATTDQAAVGATTLPPAEVTAPRVEVAAAPVPPPWAQRGGFSFVKVVLGERLAAQAAERDASPAAQKTARAEASAAGGSSAAPADPAASASALVMQMLGVSPPAQQPPLPPGPPLPAAPLMPPPPLAQPPLPAGPPPTHAMGHAPPPTAHANSASAPTECALLMGELSQQALAPWSVAHLEGLAEESRDQMLGERLYRLITLVEPERAGKVTGMLLELSDAELFELLMPVDVRAPRETRLDPTAPPRGCCLEAGCCCWEAAPRRARCPLLLAVAGRPYLPPSIPPALNRPPYSSGLLGSRASSIPPSIPPALNRPPYTLLGC